MITNTRAVVLNCLRYGDSSLIVNLYTESLGRQAVFVKGAFSKKSSVRAALFQSLHLIETEIHYRVNRQMQRISEARLIQPFLSIPFDPVKRSVAMFISEILNKTLKEEEANHELFNFLFHSIRTLDLNDCGTANFHLMFLMHYTRYLGFYLDSKQLANGFLLDLPTSGYTGSLSPLSSRFEYVPLLSQFMELSFEHLDKMQISHHQRNRLAEYLLSYYSMQVDGFGTVKSFAVLRDVFQD